MFVVQALTDLGTLSLFVVFRIILTYLLIAALSQFQFEQRMKVTKLLLTLNDAEPPGRHLGFRPHQFTKCRLLRSISPVSVSVSVCHAAFLYKHR